MNSLPIRLLGCLLLLLLAGCATPWQLPDSTFAGVRDRDLNGLLAYYQGMEGKPERDLEQERKRQQAALVANRCDTTRMQLGLTLLRAAERGMRIDNSENVMRPCLDDPRLARSNAHYLAYLIEAQLSSRRTEQQQLKNAEALKKENQELRRQVEGLKAIERSLHDRRHRE